VAPNFCSLPTRNVDASHLLGRIHSLESFGTVDGPGARFVVFLQGCLFRCKYCHNRDTWDTEGGHLYSVTDLLDEILPYYRFMEASGGGVTVSGGEPLLQREFVCVLFKALKMQGIHTCLDTNGYLAPQQYGLEIDKLMDHTDLVLLDLKHMDNEAHLRLTEISNEFPLAFARMLHERNKPTWIRFVVVPGYSDQPENVQALADFVAPMKNVEKIEILPYHELGAYKWQALGLKNPLEGVHPPERSALLAIAEVFHQRGIKTSLS